MYRLRAVALANIVIYPSQTPHMIAFATRFAASFAAVLMLRSVTHAAPAKKLADQLPPAASRTVDFARDIEPIFEASCVQCHARG